MECVQILLAVEPQMNCYYATEAACSNGHHGIVQLLVEHQPQIIELASVGADPCLLQAAIKGSAQQDKEDVLSFLLEKGVSPNVHPPGSACALATALLQEGAVHFDRLGVIQKLIKAGADVNKLEENPSLKSPSFLALKTYLCGKPSKQVLEVLIDAGLNLGVKSEETWNTFLHFLAEEMVVETDPIDQGYLVCEMMNDWGKKHTDPKEKEEGNTTSLLNALNFNEDTALMLAVRKGNLRLIEALLKCGADVSQPAFGEPSILQWLISAGSMTELLRAKMMKLLLQYGAPTDQVYPDSGRTLLHEACSRRRRTALVRALLKEGHMDPNCTIPNRKTGGDPITPLMLAISQNDVETVELLIQRGAIVGESELKVFPNNPSRGEDLTKMRKLLGIMFLPGSDAPTQLGAEKLEGLSSTSFSSPFSSTVTPTFSSTSMSSSRRSMKRVAGKKAGVESTSFSFNLTAPPVVPEEATFDPSALPKQSSSPGFSFPFLFPPTSSSSVPSSSPPFTHSSIPSTPTFPSFTLSSSTPPAFSIPPTSTSSVPSSTSASSPGGTPQSFANLPLMDPSGSYPDNYSAHPSTQESEFSFSVGGGSDSSSQQTSPTRPSTFLFGEKPSSSSS